MKFKVGDKVKIPTTKSTSFNGLSEPIECSNAVQNAKFLEQDYMFIRRIYDDTGKYAVSESMDAGGDFFLESDLELYEDNKAMRFNDGKLKWSLVHFASLTPLVQVLMFGATKYAPHNWKKPMNGEEILESMQRHLSALFDGDTHDKESKVHHIGHIFANAMFYSYHCVINKDNK